MCAGAVAEKNRTLGFGMLGTRNWHRGSAVAGEVLVAIYAHAIGGPTSRACGAQAQRAERCQKALLYPRRRHGGHVCVLDMRRHGHWMLKFEVLASHTLASHVWRSSASGCLMTSRWREAGASITSMLDGAEAATYNNACASTFFLSFVCNDYLTCARTSCAIVIREDAGGYSKLLWWWAAEGQSG